MNYCLWIEILWTCTDYVNYELSVFNIGVFMAVIWVLFAWFQLINPIHKIRYKVRYNKFILLILSIPVITSIIGTLLPFIPWNPLPALWYTIFWEIFTALYIIMIWLLLIPHLFFKKINNFDNKNWRVNRLYIHYLAKNKDIENIVDELQYFFNDFLKEYNKELSQEEWWYAHQFITIIQNQRFIDYLIESPLTIQEIIASYRDEDRNQFSYDEQQFLWKLILWSLSNDNSFLVHELNWNFNIDFRNQNWIILKSIIEDLDFLSKLNIFWDFETFWYSENQVFAKNCLTLTSKIHQEFVNKDRISQNYLKYDLLLKIFETQTWIIERSYKKLKHLSKSNLMGFNFKHSLWELKDSLLWLYPNGKFPEVKLNKEQPYWWEYHYLDSNISILDAYAFWIYKVLSAFAQYKEDDIRGYTLSFSYDVRENEVFNEIEKRLFLLYKHKINDNLVWYYPMISRVFWENYFWNILCQTEDVNWNEDIMDILRIYAEKLPKLSEWYIYAYTEDTLNDPYRKEMAIKKADTIVKDLFPDYIEYDKQNHSLSIYHRDRLSYNVLDLWKTMECWKIIIK